MKKGIIILIGIIIACITAFYIFQSKEQTANTTQKQPNSKPLEGVERLDTPIRPNIELDHVWKFPFKGEIDKNTIDNQIYILNERKQKLSVETEVNDNEITIKPPQDGYEKDKMYELFVNKDIKQVDGTNIEPIHFSFLTKRDDVAKYKYREDLIKIKKEQIDSLKDDNIVLKDLKLKDKIKKDSIVIIETKDKEHPEAAWKVVSTKEESKKLVIKTITPKFEELFEELDLYGKFPITPEHIQLEPIEGLSLTSIPSAYMASTDSAMLYAEGKGQNNYFDFNDVRIKVNGYEVGLKGKMEFNKPFGIPDVTIKNKTFERFHFHIEQRTNADLNVSVAKIEKKLPELIKKKKGEKDKKEEKWDGKVKLGKFIIPTPVPGVAVEGEVYLLVEATLSGEIKTSVEYTTEVSAGVKHEDDKWKGYMNKDFSVKKPKVYGEGKFATALKAGFGGGLTAYGVLSTGVDFQGGIFADFSGFVNEKSTTTSPFVCSKSEAGLVFSGDVIIKAAPKPWTVFDKETEYFFELKEKFAELKFANETFNNCMELQNLIPDPEVVSLNPGEDKNVSLTLKLYDRGIKKEETVKLRETDKKFISVQTKNKDVAEAEVTKSGKIKILAKKNPVQLSTEVEVTYNNPKENRKKTITIPVHINDFNTASLDGYWREEKDTKMFAILKKKDEKSIEVTYTDPFEIWSKGNVQFNALKGNKMVGTYKYTTVYDSDKPGKKPKLPPNKDFSLEKTGDNKIRIQSGNDTYNFKKSSKEELEQYHITEESLAQGGYTPPSQDNILDGAYSTPLSTDNRLYTELSFKVEDDKKAKVFVNQRINNVQENKTEFMGEFVADAVKQSDSTWKFSWTDDKGTKGTGTITFQGKDAILDLKGKRNDPNEGKGIVTQQVKVSKSS